jgi:hypothetical protein
MKPRYPIVVLAVASGAAMLTPVVSRASHPPIIPSVAHTVRTAQPIVDPSGTAHYQFTTIDAPGTSDTEAYGINNTGLVSGFYVVNGIGHGFLWQNGALQTVDHPGDRTSNTLLGDVNEPGMVASNYGPFDTQHAAIYSVGAGTWTTLPDIRICRSISETA